ncbi:unnamed protein product [Didymodactylos carnosus]|uniref:Uncharacterized protein n=1 Tax=Didymodactylos carnosus TaxID=1234261 RepID=A0A813UWL6_9BILA|nr:unnamed protein product [Didymodactylos carnosus]CAF3620468.1 unnamed protein product [Didymodactylos carnosus]
MLSNIDSEVSKLLANNEENKQQKSSKIWVLHPHANFLKFQPSEKTNPISLIIGINGVCTRDRFKITNNYKCDDSTIYNYYKNDSTIDYMINQIQKIDMLDLHHQKALECWCSSQIHERRLSTDKKFWFYWLTVILLVILSFFLLIALFLAFMYLKCQPTRRLLLLSPSQKTSTLSLSSPSLSKKQQQEAKKFFELVQNSNAPTTFKTHSTNLFEDKRSDLHSFENSENLIFDRKMEMYKIHRVLDDRNGNNNNTAAVSTEQICSTPTINKKTMHGFDITISDIRDELHLASNLTKENKMIKTNIEGNERVSLSCILKKFEEEVRKRTIMTTPLTKILSPLATSYKDHQQQQEKPFELLMKTVDHKIVDKSGEEKTKKKYNNEQENKTIPRMILLPGMKKIHHQCDDNVKKKSSIMISESQSLFEDENNIESSCSCHSCQCECTKSYSNTSTIDSSYISTDSEKPLLQLKPNRNIKN